MLLRSNAAGKQALPQINMPNIWNRDGQVR
jgi:hypothetical protein